MSFTGINLPTTSGNLIMGSGTNWQTLPIGNGGQLLMSNGSSLQYVTLTGGISSITSTGVVAFPNLLTVSNKTASATITASQIGTVFTNAGATGTVVLTLPTPTVGLSYSFVCIAAKKFEVKVANTVSQTFKCSLNGVMQSAPYLYFSGSSTSVAAYVEITAITNTIWQVTNLLGSWTFSLVS